MAMFTLYCDDSGTHTQSSIAVAACFVAPARQWEHFVRNWKEADAAEQFGVFHMADFVARKEQFALPEWNEEQKRHRSCFAILDHPGINHRIAVSSGVLAEECAAILQSFFSARR